MADTVDMVADLIMEDTAAVEVDGAEEAVVASTR